MKRGVEMSMNVIIIAAIALIVLVVLVLLVTGAFKNVSSGTGCKTLNQGSCEKLDGNTCAEATQNANAVNGGAKSDCTKDEVCCYVPLR